MDTGHAILRQEEADPITTGDLAGLRLPWRQLADWVRSVELHANDEDNWEFRITEVSPEGPISMELDHPEISMKLKVNRWEFN